MARSTKKEETRTKKHETIPISLLYWQNKDIGMVSCIFVYLCWVVSDPLFLPFWCLEPSLYPPSFEMISTYNEKH